MILYDSLVIRWLHNAELFNINTLTKPLDSSSSGFVSADIGSHHLHQNKHYVIATTEQQREIFTPCIQKYLACSRSGVWRSVVSLRPGVGGDISDWSRLRLRRVATLWTSQWSFLCQRPTTAARSFLISIIWLFPQSSHNISYLHYFNLWHGEMRCDNINFREWSS